MNIAYWLWRWWLAEVYPWFFALGIVEIDPLFITSNNAMQKWISSKRIKQNFTSGFSPFNISFNSYGTYFPSFWIFPMACKSLEIVPSSTPNAFANCFRDWVESSSSNACNSAFSNFFGGYRGSLLLKSKPPFLKHGNQSLHVVSDKACSP